MKKKSGLTPLFKSNFVTDILNDYVQERVDREVSILLRVGEEFVNQARRSGEYTDRTGNLRSSIGYILINDGKIIHQYITGKTSKGKQTAISFINEIKSVYNKGLVLVGFAGMQYAAAVESKGYDVITGSAPTQEMMRTAFSKFLK
jgi:hypothetical protein